MTGNEKRARLRLLRRRDRVRKGEPLRRTFVARPRGEEAEDKDLDTPDPDLLGMTE